VGECGCVDDRGVSEDEERVTGAVCAVYEDEDGEEEKVESALFQA
jgi:hypothetical protein